MASMIKNIPKLHQRLALIILAIMVSSLLNICLFALQAKAAPMQPLKINFAYDNGGNCVAEPMPEPTQNINRPSAPLPECCLAQNRNFNAVINTANDQSAPTFIGLIISPSANSIPENNSTYNTSRIVFPPPAALAIASTVIRE